MQTILLCVFVAVASAQIQSSTLTKAKTGCDFGVPIKGEIGWVKVPCDKTNQEAKMVGLGKEAEFLGSSKLSGFVGAETYAIHGKVNGKCCSQRVSKVSGNNKDRKFGASDLCCYDACPTWMAKC